MSKLRIKGDGWRCSKCRFFVLTKGEAYHGMCDERSEHRGVTSRIVRVMKDDWCDEYEEKKQAKAGAGQIGLLEPGEPMVSKTGGDR